MSQESKSTFFKQSGWLVIATTLSGAFLAMVYPLLKMPTSELGIFGTLLRLFTILAIPAAGIQIVFARQAAAALTDSDRENLRFTVKKVAGGIFLFWLCIAIGCAVFQEQLTHAFKLTNPMALWITLLLALGAMCLPLFQGLLQGGQNFLYLGASILLNGAGRFAGIFVMVILLHSHATGALLGALIGLGSALAVAFWPSRTLLRAARGSFSWRGWLAEMLPLTGGTGASLFLMNADILFVQSNFPKEDAPYYIATAIVGVGLVAFTTPMAAVMFPKMVRSVTRSEESNSLRLALAGTTVLACSGALLCTLFPSLPLRVMYFNQPQYWKSAPLVPWFMWSMAPVTIANVLISNLLARRRFAAVPWLVLVALGYGLALYLFVTGPARQLEPMSAFLGIIQRLGIFSLLLLGVAALFTRRSKIGS